MIFSQSDLPPLGTDSSIIPLQCFSFTPLNILERWLPLPCSSQIHRIYSLLSWSLSLARKREGRLAPSCPTLILDGECQISNTNTLAAPRFLQLEQLILDRYDSSSITTTVSSISLQVPTLAFKFFSSFLWRPLGIGHGFKLTTVALVLGLTKSFPVLCCPFTHSPLTRATGPIAEANSNILHLTAMVFRLCGQCCIMATWPQPLQVSYLSLSLLSPSVSPAGCTLGPRSKHHCRCPRYPSPSVSTAGLHSTLPEQSTLWNSLA